MQLCSIRYVYKGIRSLFCIALGMYAAPHLIAALSDRHGPQQEEIKRAQRTLINNHNRVKCALFSPDDAIHEILVGLINAAEYKISIACYVITDKRIVDALIAAHQRKVEIEVIVCRSGAQDSSSKVEQLRKQGITVFVYPHSFTRSLMHNKFVIFHRVFGRSILCTGSYNLTRSASEVNQENMLFVDDMELVTRYAERFQKIKHLSVRLTKRRPVVCEQEA